MVVGLVGVGNERSGSPEITRTSWLIRRNLNSLKRGEVADGVVHAVVAEEVADPVEVDNEQSRFLETP